MDVREKLIELIMDATNGCARYWASLIADKLLAEGVIAELAAENEQLRERHAAYDRQIKADAMTEFAESLKKYYFDTLKGSTNSSLVAHHIDEILKDKLKKLEGESQ